MNCLIKKFGVILLLGIAFVGCEDPGYVHTEEVDKLLEENKKREALEQQKRKYVSDENPNSPTSNDPLNQNLTNSSQDKSTLPSSADNKKNYPIAPLVPPLIQQPKVNDHLKPAETTKVSENDRWKILRSGLKESDVRKILGEPTTISTGEALSYWYYGEGDQAGRIALVNHPAGKVLWAWQPPQQ